MTAHQMIDSALELTPEASMLQLIQADKNLRMIGDFIIGGSLDELWTEAVQHIRLLKADQMRRAKAGEVIRLT